MLFLTPWENFALIYQRKILIFTLSAEWYISFSVLRDVIFSWIAPTAIISTFDFTMWNSHGLSSSRGKILKSFISPRSASRRDKVAGKFRFQKIFDQIKLFVEFWDKAAVFSMASDWIWIWNLTKLHDLELTALHRAGLKGNKSEYFGSCFPWKQKWSQKQS